MTSAVEAGAGAGGRGKGGAVSAAQGAGLDVLSQTVVFTPYVTTASPIDGFNFLVASSLRPVKIKGVLHFGSESVQDADERVGANNVSFVTQKQVTSFNSSDGLVWVGEIKDESGNALAFVFNSNGPFIKESGTYRYTGEAIRPAFKDLLVNSESDMVAMVTNSVPILLKMESPLKIYPAFLSGINVAPPYGVVHIAKTTPLSMMPDKDGDQLMRDSLEIVMYCNAATANAFNKKIIEGAEEAGYGIATWPELQNETREMSSLRVLAPKKTLTFDINYLKKSVAEAAKALIEEASILVTASA